MSNIIGRAYDFLVPIQIAVNQDVFQRFQDLEADFAGIENNLNLTMSELGLSARVVVEYSLSEMDRDEFIHLRVNNSRVYFPTWIYTIALQQVVGIVWKKDNKITSILDRTLELNIEDLIRFLTNSLDLAMRLSASQIINKQNTDLLREALFKDSENDDYLLSTDDLYAIIQNVLSMNMSLHDTFTVKELLSTIKDDEMAVTVLSEELITKLRPRTIKIELTRFTLQRLSIDLWRDDREAFNLMRHRIEYRYGVFLPKIEWVINDTLAENTIRLIINHTFVIELPILPQQYVVLNETPEVTKIKVINDIDFVVNPITNNRYSVIAKNLLPDYYLSSSSPVKMWGNLGYLALIVEGFLNYYSWKLIDVAVCTNAITELSETEPALVRITYTMFSPAYLCRLLRQLTVEGLSLRHIQHILQTACEFKAISNYSLNQSLSDTSLYPIVNDIRGKSNAYIFDEIANPYRQIYLLYDEKIKELCKDLELALEQTHELDEIVADNFIAHISDKLKSIKNVDQRSIAILVPEKEIRMSLWKLVSSKFPQLFVLSSNDIDQVNFKRQNFQIVQ